MNDKNKEVTVVECSIFFDLDLRLCAEMLNLSLEKVREAWNNKELVNLLSERFSPIGVLRMITREGHESWIDIGDEVIK